MIRVPDSSTGTSFVIKLHPLTGKNAACIEFFAKLLNVPRASVSIACGKNRRVRSIF
jgi:uncharacterized protein YggU (UPF0235/DUF167 family)